MAGVDHAIFEGLFVRSLNVSGALADELKQAGFDRNAIQPRYPGSVLVACLEIAAKHLHSDCSRAEGIRRLGRQFVGGFQQTIIGRVATAALPILGPQMFVPRVPGRLRSIRDDASVELERLGPSSAALRFADPLPLGDFFAGVLEEALRVAKAQDPRVELAPHPGGYVITLSW